MTRIRPLLLSALAVPLLATGCGDATDASDADTADADAAERALVAHQVTEDLQNLVLHLTPSFSPGELITPARYRDGLAGLLHGDMAFAACASIDKGDADVVVTFDACDLKGVYLDGTVAVGIDLDIPGASATVSGATDGLVIGDTTIAGSFEATASLFDKAISWNSSLDVDSAKLDKGFALSVVAETRVELGRLVYDCRVDFETDDGQHAVTITMDAITIDIATRIANHDKGVCPDSGSVELSANELSGQVQFNDDDTVSVYVNGEPVPYASDACILADIYLSMLVH